MKPLALLTPHHIASLKPRDKEYAVDDAQCAGLRLRILPGGTKSWVIFRRIDGRPRRITLGHWPDLALIAARAMYYAREAELASQTKVRAQPPLTLDFATLAGRFMEHIRVIQALLGHSKLTTTARYASVATGMIAAVDSPLDDLNEARRKKGKPKSS